MIYKFTLDDVDYEAEVTVTPGRDATGPTMDGPGDPPEDPEIEIEHIWLRVKGRREIELPPAFEDYADVEKHVLDHSDDILEQAGEEAMDAKADASEARNDRMKEDGI